MASWSCLPGFGFLSLLLEVGSLSVRAIIASNSARSNGSDAQNGLLANRKVLAQTTGLTLQHRREYARLRQTPPGSGHTSVTKPFLRGSERGHSVGFVCAEGRVWRGFCGWCREGELNPQGAKQRRILRSWKAITT